jgi:uncharacterized protein YegL
MPDQVPFVPQDFGAGLEFAENPEQRCPCILLLDTSRSMTGEPIAQLNDGLTAYRADLSLDTLAAKRVETAIITFGGQVRTLCDFAVASALNPGSLTAEGETPMGAAILQGIDMLRKRKDEYKSNGIAYYRPWLFLITDGVPTDDWKPAADEVKNGESKNAFAFFSVGVEGADFETLKQIGVREPLRLQGLRFKPLFLWLSSSLRSVSRSQPEDVVPLANPAIPAGWAAV